MKKLLLPSFVVAVFSCFHTGSARAQTQNQITVAHRGLFLQQGSELAENTLTAIEYAYDHGYQYVELDIRVTSDGKAILMHDNAQDPVSGTDTNFCRFQSPAHDELGRNER
jgi:glycerophosphoryl diester phosphodiesterase